MLPFLGTGLLRRIWGRLLLALPATRVVPVWERSFASHSGVGISVLANVHLQHRGCWWEMLGDQQLSSTSWHVVVIKSLPRQQCPRGSVPKGAAEMQGAVSILAPASPLCLGRAGAARVALSWGVGILERIAVSVACALATGEDAKQLPSPLPGHAVLSPAQPKSQCHLGDVKQLPQLLGLWCLLGNSCTSVATVTSGREWGWPQPPALLPSLMQLLITPASRSPLGGCGASLTYSAADLKGAVLILLENARCPSVPDRPGHSPVLSRRWSPRGEQAAATPAQR